MTKPSMTQQRYLKKMSECYLGYIMVKRELERFACWDQRLAGAWKTLHWRGMGIQYSLEDNNET
jgi:hypothetical protein